MPDQYEIFTKNTILKTNGQLHYFVLSKDFYSKEQDPDPHHYKLKGFRTVPVSEGFGCSTLTDRSQHTPVAKQMLSRRG